MSYPSHTHYNSYQSPSIIPPMQHFPSAPINTYTSNIDPGKYSDNGIVFIGSPTYISSVSPNNYLNSNYPNNNFSSSYQHIEKSEFVKRSAVPTIESRANNINFENKASSGQPLKNDYAMKYNEQNNFLNEERFNATKAQAEKLLLNSTAAPLKHDFASNFDEQNSKSKGISTIMKSHIEKTVVTSSAISSSSSNKINYEEKITNLIREIDELKNDKASLAEKIQSSAFFDEKVEAYEKRISELLNKIAQLEQEQRENKKKKSDSIEITVDLKTKFTMLQNEFQASQTENQNLQSIIKELQLKLSNFQNWQMEKKENDRKFSILTGDYEQLVVLAKERLDQIEILKNKFIVVEGELREIPILQSKIKDYEIQFNLLNKDIAALKETIKVLESDKLTLKEDIESQRKTYEEQIRNLKRELDQINVLKIELENEKNANISLKNELKEQEDILQAAGNELMKMKEQMTVIIRENNELKEALRLLQETKNEMEKALVAMDSRIQSLLREKGELDQKLTKNEEKVKRGADNHSSIERQKRELLATIEELKGKISLQEQTIRDLTDKNQAFTQKFFNFEQKIANLESENMSVRNQYDSLQSQARNNVTTLDELSKLKAKIDQSTQENSNQRLSFENDLKRISIDYENKIRQFHEERSKLISELDLLRNDYKEYNSKIAVLEAEIVRLSMDLANKDSELSSFRKNYEQEKMILEQELKKEFDKHNIVVQRYEEEIQRLKALQFDREALLDKIRRLEQELIERRNQENEKISKLNNEIATLKNENQNLKNEVGKLEKRIQEQDDALKRLINERDSILEENKRIKKEFEKAIAKMEEYELVILEIPGLEEQIKKYKELFEKSNQENSALKSNLNALEARLREVETAHRRCAGEIDSLKGEVTKTKVIDSEMENKNRSQLNEIKELQNKIKLLTTENNDLKRKLKEIEVKYNDLMKNSALLVELQNKVKTLQQELSSLQQDYEVLMNKYKSLQDQLQQTSHLSEENDALLLEIQDLRRQLENLSKNYNDLCMDYDDLLLKYEKLKKDSIEVDLLNQKNKEFEKNTSNLRKEIEGLSLIVKQRNEEIDKWRGQNSKLEMHINEIRLKENMFIDLQKKNDGLKKENDGLRIKIEEYISTSKTTIISSQTINSCNKCNYHLSEIEVLNEKLIQMEQELSKTIQMYHQAKSDNDMIAQMKDRMIEMQSTLNLKTQENESLLQKLNYFMNSQESVYRENRIQILEAKIQKLVDELEDWKTRYDYLQNVILSRLNGTVEIENLKEVYENKVALLASEINRLNQLLNRNEEILGKWKLT